ncbi:hypothetical protein DM860_017355 [Cuscuta australis]|uniref:Uncharacterized protein n=1 Tax=Cuscuta australis TaxID=267555 RepID=A0A328DCM8_9ASTE|nr:hypothetical protein DM860_017355 [Cuscuta australis]
MNAISLALDYNMGVIVFGRRDWTSMIGNDKGRSKAFFQKVSQEAKARGCTYHHDSLYCLLRLFWEPCRAALVPIEDVLFCCVFIPSFTLNDLCSQKKIGYGFVVLIMIWNLSNEGEVQINSPGF